MPKFVSENNEETVDLGGSGQLVVRKGRTKLRPEEVSISQWISANSRILSKLVREGQLDAQGLHEYLEYTACIGDYLQTHTTSSVMIFDHTHRKNKVEQRKRWSDIDFHSMFYYLEKKDSVRKAKASYKQGVQGKDTICLNFQNPGGCRFQNCKYLHVCIQCQGSHPQHKHNDTSSQRSGNYTSHPQHRVH